MNQTQYTVLYILVGILIVLQLINLATHPVHNSPMTMGTDIQLEGGTNVTGVMIHNPSMLVALNNRNSEAIKNTLDHEYLHYLIKENRSHFCGVEG